MSDASNLVHGLELRNIAGQSLGTFRSEAAVQELAAERDRLSKELALVQNERDRIRAELEEVRKERDEYERTIHFLSQREFAITRDDIADMERDGITFDDVMQDLDRIAQGKADG